MTTQSHYLNQCWIDKCWIDEVLLQLYTECPRYNDFEQYAFEIPITLAKGQSFEGDFLCDNVIDFALFYIQLAMIVHH